MTTGNQENPKTTSGIQKRSRNAEERALETAAASSAVVAYDPEVELIDSSRISADLANLRFMRMEKQKENNDNSYSNAEKDI